MDRQKRRRIQKMSNRTIIDPFYSKSVEISCWCDNDKLVIGKCRPSYDEQEYIANFNMELSPYWTYRLKQAKSFLFNKENDYYYESVIFVMYEQILEFIEALKNMDNDDYYDFLNNKELYSKVSNKSIKITEEVKQKYYKDDDIEFVFAIGDPQIVIARYKDNDSYEIGCRYKADYRFNLLYKFDIAFDHVRGIKRYWIDKNEIVLSEPEFQYMVIELSKDINKVKNMLEEREKNKK